MKTNNCKYLIGQTLLILVCLFGTVSLTANAQAGSDNEKNNLRVIFIDHEPSLPVRDVISYIRKQRAMAKENANSLIIYMPNDQTPFISLTNVRNPYDNDDDTQEAFDAICEALNQASHNKEPWYDRNALVKLFSDYGIMDDSGDLLFSAVRMEFFLTSEFWNLGYNESIIAPVFFAIDGANLLKKNFNFDVYVNPNDKPKYDEKAPFGKNNLGGINQLINLYDYDF